MLVFLGGELGVGGGRTRKTRAGMCRDELFYMAKSLADSVPIMLNMHQNQEALIAVGSCTCRYCTAVGVLASENQAVPGSYLGG